ncbi:MAG: adenylate/guanylate cyclase domain-containing protein [Desulfobacterales bacterium]|nr:adenylate/guanylate cyclase domain-containing protein [Desulfobacterales bacterium]
MPTVHSKMRALFFKSTNDYMVIGQVLKMKNLVTDEQLETAVKVQRDTLADQGQAISLGMILAELGYVSEAEIVRAINAHYHLDVTSLADDIKGLVGRKRGTFVERLPAPRIPIWLQFSAVIIAITVLTTFVLNFFILSRQKDQLYDQSKKIGMVSLNYFAANARIPLLEDDILQLNTLIKNTTAVEGLVYAVIVDQDQKIKAHTDHDQIGKILNKSEPLSTETREGEITYFTTRLPTGRQVLNLAHPVRFQDKLLGEVHVGVSIDFINELIRQNKKSVVSLTLTIILVGILVALLMGLRFSHPIEKLVFATQEIGRGNYHHKVQLGRNDELGNLATAFNQMGNELLRKSRMQESFGKYVGAEVLDMILANPEVNWLKGHRNRATTLIADIRGFTAYSDIREPEAVVEALNEYFEIATRTIIHYGGYIDKFIGDAVLAVFGVPVYRRNHLERALRAALDLQAELKKASGGGNVLLGAVGISIDTGEVVAGNIGTQEKMEYTVIGDSVNSASRLNGLAGPGEVIISQAVFQTMGVLVDAEPLGPRQIKGVSEAVISYRLKSIRKAVVSDATRIQRPA